MLGCWRILCVAPLPLRAFALSGRQEATEGREDGSEDQGQGKPPERITGRSTGLKSPLATALEEQPFPERAAHVVQLGV
jgi:hypothetical protein